MKTKLLFVLGVLATLGTVLLFFSGCAQPPTEKVTAVQSNLKECVAKGAQLFAKEEYNNVVMKANELNNLMDQKKYRKANTLADTVLADITILKATVDTNGRKMTQQMAADVDNELKKFKALLTTEDSKLLDNASKMNYNTIIGTLENDVNALQKSISSADYVGVYKVAGAIKGRMTASEQEVAQKIEQAKAQAAEKALKAKKGTAKKPAGTPTKKPAAPTTKKPAAPTTKKPAGTSK